MIPEKFDKLEKFTKFGEFTEPILDRKKLQF